MNSKFLLPYVMRWDVFISHASEDKEDVARPLAQLLQKAGLQVWLDENELRLGDSLNGKIDEGLAESQFGIVILSRHFFAKRWTKRELAGLARTIRERTSDGKFAGGEGPEDARKRWQGSNDGWF